MEGAQAGEAQVETGPEALQFGDEGEVVLEHLAGGADLGLVRREEQGVHLHAAGDHEDVADHAVGDFAVGGAVGAVDHLAKGSGVCFAAGGVGSDQGVVGVAEWGALWLESVLWSGSSLNHFGGECIGDSKQTFDRKNAYQALWRNW